MSNIPKMEQLPTPASGHLFLESDGEKSWETYKKLLKMTIDSGFSEPNWSWSMLSNVSSVFITYALIPSGCLR